MLQKTRTLLACASLVFAATRDGHAQQTCPGSPDYVAVPNCTSPAFHIIGLDSYNCDPVTENCVTVSQSGGEWSLDFFVQNGAFIKIVALQPNLVFNRISFCGFGTNPATAEVVLGGEYPIGLIRGIAYDDNPPFGTPDVHLTISGNNDTASDVVEMHDIGTYFLKDIQITGDLGTYLGSPPSMTLTGANVAKQLDTVTVGGDLISQVFVGGAGFTTGNQIENLDVHGTIGSATDPEAGLIQTTGDIGTIEAGLIYGKIYAGQTGFRDVIGLIDCVVDENHTGGGHFMGTIVAKELLDHFPSDEPGRIHVAGDFGGSLTLDEAIANQGDAELSPIIIGGSLLSGASINLPANGLVGYIVIGDEDEGGEWEEGAVVSVGSVDLEEPDYDTLPGAVGGASVGVAPFALYDAACSPRDQSVHVLHVSPTCWLEGDPSCLELLACASSLTSVDMRFYGPVDGPTSPTDADGRVFIERRTIGGTPGEWIPVTEDFQIEVRVESGTGIRSIVRITPDGFADFGEGVQYRVTNGSTTPLKAYAVTSTPPALDFEYNFTVIFDCRGGLVDLFDLNEDGVVSFADILQWLITMQDLNYDGEMDDIDFAILLQAITYYNALP